MEKAAALIAAFRELNRKSGTTVANFTPSLIGMFGSISLFDEFLAEIEEALANGTISPPLKKRAANLADTFIPQVADYNAIKNAAEYPVSAEALSAISPETLGGRTEGVAIILSALMAILKDAGELGPIGE